MRLPKVEISPNKAVYEKMRAEGATLKEIQAKAKELGEDISISAIARYFKNYWRPALKAEVSSDQILREKAYRLQEEWRNVMDLCSQNIQVLRAEATALTLKKKDDPKSLQALVSVLREIRLTARDLFNYIKKINELTGMSEADREIKAMRRAIERILPAEKTKELLEVYEEELAKL